MEGGVVTDVPHVLRGTAVDLGGEPNAPVPRASKSVSLVLGNGSSMLIKQVLGFVCQLAAFFDTLPQFLLGGFNFPQPQVFLSPIHVRP